jgi:flagellar assembly factor FliW
MKIQSERFGYLEIPDNKMIRMKKPILGFERLERFCLIEQDEFRPFMWLQAVDDPGVAFIVVNPLVFFPDYHIAVHSKEVADLRITSTEKVETYVIVTVPEKLKEMSVNLQGPIVINSENRLAKQLVLVNSSYQVQHPLMDVVETTPHTETVHIEEPVGV